MNQPNALPVANADYVELVICRGPQRCEQPEAAPCPFCLRVSADEGVEGIAAKLAERH